MSFVKITEYDGEKGYLAQEKLTLFVLARSGKKYLVNFDAGEIVYRIVRESKGKRIARAVKIKDSKLIEMLGSEYVSRKAVEEENIADMLKGGKFLVKLLIS